VGFRLAIPVIIPSIVQKGQCDLFELLQSTGSSIPGCRSLTGHRPGVGACGYQGFPHSPSPIFMGFPRFRRG
jgi:hypothetical protein